MAEEDEDVVLAGIPSLITLLREVHGMNLMLKQGETDQPTVVNI